MTQKILLQWNNHVKMIDEFKKFLSREELVDVTLACDGKSLKAHKLVLSAYSSFFQAVFSENPCKHPIVVLKDVDYAELKAVVDFMYGGEVWVTEDHLESLLSTAKNLKVKVLGEIMVKGKHSHHDDGDRSDATPPASPNGKESEMQSGAVPQNQSVDKTLIQSVTRTDTPSPKRRRRKTRKRSVCNQTDNKVSESENELSVSGTEEFPDVTEPRTPDSNFIPAPVLSPIFKSSQKTQTLQPKDTNIFVSRKPFEDFPPNLHAEVLTHSSMETDQSSSDPISKHNLKEQCQEVIDISEEHLPSSINDSNKEEVDDLNEKQSGTGDSKMEQCISTDLKIELHSPDNSIKEQCNPSDLKVKSCSPSTLNKEYSPDHLNEKQDYLHCSTNEQCLQSPVKSDKTEQSQSTPGCSDDQLSSPDYSASYFLHQIPCRHRMPIVVCELISIPTINQQLKTHAATHDKKLVKKKELKNGSRKIFHQSPMFKKHDNSEDSDSRPSRTVLNKIENTSGLVKFYRCKKCSYQSHHSVSLKRHNILKHARNRKFQCDQCPFAAAVKQNLERHRAEVHEQTKYKFRCSMCPYRCDQIGTLRRHIQCVHEGIKPYRCEECDFRSSQRANVRKHIAAIHEKKRDYTCSCCDYSCTTFQSLKRHKKKMHEKKEAV